MKKYKKYIQIFGYKVITTVANQKKGVDELFNNNITEEGAISKKNKKGKNTTTAIKLYKIQENTYIADTPRIWSI